MRIFDTKAWVERVCEGDRTSWEVVDKVDTPFMAKTTIDRVGPAAASLCLFTLRRL
jgi:hypothetical protein